MKFLHTVAFIATTLCVAMPVVAQEYPNRPVRLFVGFPPGGSTDILARALAHELTEALGKPFVVENRAGANSLIATQELIKAAPDGYTLQMTHSSHVTNPLFYESKPYDPVNDVTPVTTIARSPFVLLAHKSLGVTTLSELIGLAKSKPDEINYGSPGNGSMQQLSQALLLTRTGTKMVHVPYKGGGPAMADLLAGHIPLLFSTTVQALPYIKEGQAIPLAVTSPKRQSLLPDVPAIAETVAGFESDLWHGMIAPRGTPPAVVEKLRTASARIMNTPEMLKRLEAMGAEPFQTSLDQFSRLLSDENVKWSGLLADMGLKAGSR